jgi:hypothetical protein
LSFKEGKEREREREGFLKREKFPEDVVPISIETFFPEGTFRP